VAHAASVQEELLRTELERLRAERASKGAFGEPSSAAQQAAAGAAASSVAREAAAQAALAAERVKAQHAMRKLSQQEGAVDQLRARVAQLMEKSEHTAQEQKAAFERVHGRQARPGDLGDAASARFIAGYEAKLQALERRLQDSQAAQAALQVGGAATPPPHPVNHFAVEVASSEGGGTGGDRSPTPPPCPRPPGGQC
jgi:uncharacterized coiled-coil protein SlyX